MVFQRRTRLASSVIQAVSFDFGGTLVQTKSWAEIRREGTKATYIFLKKRRLKQRFEDYATVNKKVFMRYAEIGDRG